MGGSVVLPLWDQLPRPRDHDGGAGRSCGSQHDLSLGSEIRPRNAKAAKRFLGKAIKGCKDWEKPSKINTDKAGCYTQAIRELKEEGKYPKDVEHRQVKYLNNIIEADHGNLKQLIKPVRGFKTMKTAYATIKGFEVMRALRKGQALAFNLTRDPIGEKRMIERVFGVGPCVMAETMTWLEQQLAA